MSRAQSDVGSVEPPPGVPPGVLGMVMLGRAGYEQVTATVLDLASRGHLRITRLPQDAGKSYDLIWWELEATRGRDEIRDYERVLMQELGVRTGPERFPSLTNRSSDKVAAALVKEAAHRGWYVYDPARRRRTALLWCGAAALTALVIAVVLTMFAPKGGYSFLLVLMALVALLPATRCGAPRRTRDGENLAELGTAFQSALHAYRPDVDARWFPHAVAVGRSREFARALAVRKEPPPQWIVADDEPPLTWAIISDLALEGSPYGLSAAAGLNMGPFGG